MTRPTKKSIKAVESELFDIELLLDGLISKVPDTWIAHDEVRNAIMAIQDARSLLNDRLQGRTPFHADESYK